MVDTLTASEGKITLNNVLLFDPTRTMGIRTRFVAQMTKRFNALKRVVREHILGGALLKNPGIEQLLTQNVDWTPRYDPKKIPDFMSWLDEQNEKFVLSQGGTGFEFVPRPDTQWTDRYIRSAYQRGIARGRTELRRAGADIPEGQALGGGLSSAFNQPIHTTRMELAFTQTYEGLKGVTKSMSAQISRTLAEGMGRGDSPKEIANLVTDRIDKIGLTRAKTLARTEVIRAHHNANINEYEAAGIEGVKVKAEWSTAGFNVCIICSSNEGRVFSLKAIRTLIPAHPNCRCVALPVVPQVRIEKIKARKAARIGRKVKRKAPKPKTEGAFSSMSKSMRAKIDAETKQVTAIIDKRSKKDFIDGGFYKGFKKGKAVWETDMDYVVKKHFVDKYGEKKGLAYFTENRKLLRGWKGGSSGTGGKLLKGLAERSGISDRTIYHSKFLDLDEKRIKAFKEGVEKEINKRVAAWAKKGVEGFDYDEFFRSSYSINQAMLRKVEGKTIRLYRGVSKEFFDKAGDIAKTGKMQFNSLSSWSEEISQAKGFAMGAMDPKNVGRRQIGGGIFTIDVPVEQVVFSENVAGIAQLDAGEYLLAGRVTNYKLQRVTTEMIKKGL